MKKVVKASHQGCLCRLQMKKEKENKKILVQLKISTIPSVYSVCSDPVYERGYLIVSACLHGIKN